MSTCTLHWTAFVDCTKPAWSLTISNTFYLPLTRIQRRTAQPWTYSATTTFLILPLSPPSRRLFDCLHWQLVTLVNFQPWHIMDKAETACSQLERLGMVETHSQLLCSFKYNFIPTLSKITLLHPAGRTRTIGGACRETLQASQRSGWKRKEYQMLLCSSSADARVPLSSVRGKQAPTVDDAAMYPMKHTKKMKFTLQF